MELYTFNRQNAYNVYSKHECKIRVKPNGQIAFSKGFSNVLQLKTGDGILFHQDKKNTIDWYIEKTKDESGIRINQATNKVFGFSSRRIASEILKSVNCEGMSTSFKVAKNPTEGKYYAIITKSAKTKLNKELS